MEITSTRITQTIVEQAVHLGYNVTVRYEIESGKTKPTSVTATAVKVPVEGNQQQNPAPMMGNVNVTVANGNTNTNKPAGTPAQLIDDLEAHCLSLINGEEA